MSFADGQATILDADDRVRPTADGRDLGVGEIGIVLRPILDEERDTWGHSFPSL